MAEATVFLSKDLKEHENASVFTRTLELILKEIVSLSRVDVNVSPSPDCSPKLIVTMRDFGGFNGETADEIGRRVKQLASEQFNLGKDQVSVTLSAVLMV